MNLPVYLDDAIVSIYIIKCIRNRRKAPDIMGRKRKNGPREPNGKPSRAMNPTKYKEPEAANETPLQLRAKVFGLTMQEARDQKAGSFIGRLQMLHRRDATDPSGLSQEQYDAGIRYLELRNQFQKQIGSGEAIYERTEGLTSVMSEADRESQWHKIKARWGDVRQCIQDAQNQQRGNLWAALDYCVVRNEAHGQMIGDLRLALNALAKFFERGKARTAA